MNDLALHLRHHRRSAPSSSVEPLLPFIDRGRLFTSASGQVLFHLHGLTQRILPVRSRHFREWLLGACFNETGGIPSPYALRALIHLLEARAAYNREFTITPIGCRVASPSPGYFPDTIFLNLANSEDEYVEIGPQGWNVSQGDPQSFIGLRPSRAMRRQFTPLPSENPAADLETLRSCLNLPRPEWLRALIWLLSAFRPSGPYPVLVLQGPPGCGKSFAATILRTIIDPATAPLNPVPAGPRELSVLARQNWVLAFDHISAFPPHLSAALCRLSSNAGLPLRERGEPEPLQEPCSRPILLTVTDRWSCPPEFAARCLTLTLPPLAPDAYRAESQLLTAIHQVWPRVLGAFYSALSAILAAHAASPTPETLAPAGRHAGALSWALPSAPLLGTSRDELRAAIGPDPTPHPLLQAIRHLLDQRRSWTGTATQLAALLQPAFPSAAPKVLSQHLKQHALILAYAGIELRFNRLHEGRRIIHLERDEGDAPCPFPPDGASPESALAQETQVNEQLTET